jgi:predicted SprT family Zn-dependent metalloprotease
MKKRSSRAKLANAPDKIVSLPMRRLAARWAHPLLSAGKRRAPLARTELVELAYDYFERFLPFFTEQPEGSISTEVALEFTPRMRQKLGLAYLFEHRVRLNESYFAEDPSLLPYTLFHEMTHLWLYDSLLDPGHTWRFYRKMSEFASTGLPIDPDVHIHSRVAPEGKYVYSCPNCRNRWYLRDRLNHSIYCGHCFDRDGVEHFARRVKAPSLPPVSSPDVSHEPPDSETAA